MVYQKLYTLTNVASSSPDYGSAVLPKTRNPQVEIITVSPTGSWSCWKSTNSNLHIMLQTKAEIGIVTSFSSNLLTTPASTQPLDWLLTSFYTAEKREYQLTSLVQYQSNTQIHLDSTHWIFTHVWRKLSSMHNRKLNFHNNNRKKDVTRRFAHTYNIDDLVWLHDPTKWGTKSTPIGQVHIQSYDDDGLNYRIADIHNERYQKAVHHNRLKLFRSKVPQQPKK